MIAGSVGDNSAIPRVLLVAPTRPPLRGRSSNSPPPPESGPFGWRRSGELPVCRLLETSRDLSWSSGTDGPELLGPPATSTEQRLHATASHRSRFRRGWYFSAPGLPDVALSSPSPIPRQGMGLPSPGQFAKLVCKRRRLPVVVLYCSHVALLDARPCY